MATIWEECHKFSKTFDSLYSTKSRFSMSVGRELDRDLVESNALFLELAAAQEELAKHGCSLDRLCHIRRGGHRQSLEDDDVAEVVMAHSVEFGSSTDA